MRVLILAAGYGTRLYPLTINVPKPLVPINGCPIINFLLDKVKGLNSSSPVKEVRVVSNDRFYKNFVAWVKEYRVKAQIVNDGTKTPEERLGAIRDIKLGIGQTRDDWLVLGGDNLFEDDLTKFVSLVKKRKGHPVVGVHDVGTKREATRFGIVKVNAQGRMVEFKEKPKRPTSTLAATCIYFFPKETLHYLDLFLSSDENTDASGKYIAWLLNHTEVFAYVLNGQWLDIGHHDALREAKELFFHNGGNHGTKKTTEKARRN